MTNNFRDIYRNGMSPAELAEAVLLNEYRGKAPVFPIDPFKLMRNYGIVYQFMDFRDLEGLYLVPEDENDIAVVGINKKRPITRQRFTAAHELCHHLKDRVNETCEINSRNTLERFAEAFAAELLMPRQELKEIADSYAIAGKVSFENAVKISDYFGVSFNSCVRRLAGVFHMIDCPKIELSKAIKKFKPDKFKASIGLEIDPIILERQAIDSYEFFFTIEKNLVWYKFKNDFIYNENRMEGLNLDEEEVAEIITDLRMNHQNSIYCKENYEDVIQVLGHSAVYDYISETNDTLTIYKLLDLNRKLFQYAPYPDEAGKTRTDNTLVLGTKFETIDWQDVAQELIKLQLPIDELIKNKDSFSISEYIIECLKIHHRITQIHPFRDGNGRSARALLNWMLRLKGLPPIYFRVTEKDSYYAALEYADEHGDYTELLRVTIRELYRTIIRLQSESV